MRLLVTLINFVVLSLGLSSHAATLAGLSQADLIKRADVIVHATPVRQVSRWQGARIVTTYTLSVSDYLAGEGPRDLQVELLGGQVDGLAQHVSGVPVLELREPKLLFLRKNSKNTIFSPLQLGLGVFRFDTAKKTWTPQVSDAHILGKVPSATSLNDLRAQIKILRASE